MARSMRENATWRLDAPQSRLKDCDIVCSRPRIGGYPRYRSRFVRRAFLFRWFLAGGRVDDYKRYDTMALIEPSRIELFARSGSRSRALETRSRCSTCPSSLICG